MRESIYLDNNATTRPLPQVVRAMADAAERLFANPSSTHPRGQEVRHQVELARERAAARIGAGRKEIVFTSGGTEAIQLAIRGTLASHPERRHVVTSTAEHPAVKELALAVQGEGYEVDLISVDQQGRLNVDELASKVRPDTALVSLLLANHETGVITDVEAVMDILKPLETPVHVDAVQAVGKLPISVASLGADLLSFSAHKFHGPKGVGGLYVRKGFSIRPTLVGGPHEFGLRAGTENVPGIIGLGVACEVDHAEASAQTALLRNHFEQEIQKRIPGVEIHGSDCSRVCNTSNVYFPGVSAEALLIILGEHDIHASAGAACSSGSIEPSPVLLAMGYSPEHARSSVRFSFSRFNTADQVDTVLDVLPRLNERVRAVSR